MGWRLVAPKQAAGKELKMSELLAAARLQELKRCKGHLSHICHHEACIEDDLDQDPTQVWLLWWFARLRKPHLAGQAQGVRKS